MSSPPAVDQSIPSPFLWLASQRVLGTFAYLQREARGGGGVAAEGKEQQKGRSGGGQVENREALMDKAHVTLRRVLEVCHLTATSSPGGGGAHAGPGHGKAEQAAAEQAAAASRRLHEAKDGKVFDRLAALTDPGLPPGAPQAREARRDLLERLGSSQNPKASDLTAALLNAGLPLLIQVGGDVDSHPG